jgi:hypothetical protein
MKLRSWKMNIMIAKLVLTLIIKRKNHQRTILHKLRNKYIDIDLEAIILIEDKIWSIDNLLPNDYYDISKKVYKKLVEQLGALTSDGKNMKTLKASLILEYIVVIMSTLFTTEPKKGTVSVTNKNLSYYIHQNMLLMIDIIIGKLPIKESSKEWMANLKTIIGNKLSQMSITTHTTTK